MKRKQGLLAVLVACGLGLGAVGIAAQSAPAPGPPSFDSAGSDMTPAQAAAFTDFPLYYVGDELDGHRLQAIHRRLYQSPGVPRRTNYVSLKYGSCAPTPDAGCPAPLEIQISPICESNPSLYTATPPAPDGTPAEPLPRQDVQVRGIPASFFERGHLKLYAGDVTVTIYGSSRAHALGAAAALRGLNAALNRGVPANKGGLPGPAPGALTGKLNC